MPYFYDNNINVLFIHIPKTGGTSIEDYFYSKFNIEPNTKSLFNWIDEDTKINNNMIIESSLQHITYKQMIQYNNVFNIDFNNIKLITIVRNPYERIISDLFFFDKIKLDTSPNEIFIIIQEYLKSNEYDNHNLPQHIFITDNDKDKTIIPNLCILHTETLTSDMKNLGYEDFELCINHNKYGKLNYYNYLNNESISFINDFYHYDFILFGYSKLTFEQNT